MVHLDVSTGPALLVNTEQAMRIAVAFAREAARSPRSRLCFACVDVLAVAGAGITLMGGDRGGPVCVSSSRMATLEEWQFTMGEGPCHDAYRRNQPVLAPHMDISAEELWPSFVDIARANAIGSVFAFPLAAKGANVGVLTLYQDTEGDLTVRQHEDTLAIVEVIATTVLDLQQAAPTGTLAPELGEAVAYRAEIHQASGMVAIQLAIPVADALIRIRAYAFSMNTPIGQVAADIVRRRLRLTDDRDTEEGTPR